MGIRWGRSIDVLGPLDGPLIASILPGELTHSRRHKHSQSGGVGLPLVLEVDSSDDEEDFELEPPPVLADSAVLAAADYTHEQDHSSDEGSQSNGGTDSEDE